MPDNHPLYKLGKKPYDPSVKKLMLADYLTSALPAPPKGRMWLPVVPYGMMLNDTLSDCVAAAFGHALQIWSHDASKEITIPDSAVLAFYESAGGYVPGNPATDQGMVLTWALAEFQINGIGGYKIDASAFILPTQTVHIQQGINLFGLVDGGFALPISAQNQVGGIWEVPAGGPVGDGAPGSWGGHSAVIGGFDASFLYLVTWGQIQRMTWQFWNTYGDESYVMVSPQWLSKLGKAPSGLKLAQLLADAKVLAG